MKYDRTSDFSSYKPGDCFLLHHENKDIGALKCHLSFLDEQGMALVVRGRRNFFDYSEFEEGLVREGNELRVYE